MFDTVLTTHRLKSNTLFQQGKMEIVNGMESMSQNNIQKLFKRLGKYLLAFHY